MFWRRKKTVAQRPLELCMIAQRFPILGRATDHGFLWPIARGLAQKGHRVVVIAGKSPIGKYEVVRDQVQVYYVGEGNTSLAQMPFAKAALQLFENLHQKRPFDLVHSIDRSAYLIGRRKRRFKVAMAYDVEATQMSQVLSILAMGRNDWRSLITTALAVTYKFLTTYLSQDRELLRTADGVFVTTPNQRTFLERYYLFPDFRTYTVPYGVEISDLSPRPQATDVREQHKIPPNSHVIVTVGDLIETQEMDVLLHAFEKVAVKKPNAFLVIIGNGPGAREIEYRILSLALGGRVRMTGSLTPDETSDWLSVSEIYVNLSSRTNGFETTMIEAMAQKKIIIGSEVSPMAQLVEDGVDGFLIRPADQESLSQLMLDVFSGALPVQEVGLRAREKVLKLFDTKQMVQAIEDAYRRILEQRGSS